MGNMCSRNGSWSDQQVMQAWLPLLADLFMYDNTGKIIGINDSFHQESEIVKNQISTIPILLQGKSGVSKKTVNNIKEHSRAFMAQRINNDE